MQKIRKDDTVIVITGKDKGRTGTELKLMMDKDNILVSGINKVKKHQKANPQAMARLKEFYNEKVIPQLMEKFSYKSVMEAPRITKITLNMGVGEALADKKILENAKNDMTKIAGQKPQTTLARKSVAGFKIREGYPIGCKVTLRKQRMYEFLDRLISISIPRVRDFRGLNPKSFDGRGNYSMGVKEQIIFPEIDYDTIDTLRGMDITITTTAKTNEEGKALLEAFNFPFKKK